MSATTDLYAQSGVSIDAGDETVNRIKDSVAATHTDAVLTGIGSFGTLFDLSKILEQGYKQPVLVQSIDGVGTKLIVAEMAHKFNGVGHDIVNHSCNDIVVMGARPLTFLDYIANETLKPEIVAEMVEGMAQACQESGVSLVGGETAEMPGTYQPGQHDIAGAITGIVERDAIITGEKISDGDVIIGLSSNGLHTNGYSLARKILFEHYDVNSDVEGIGNLGAALLAPHINYAPEILDLLDAGIELNGMVHVTGGGFYGNIPRVVPAGLEAVIDSQAWQVPAIFSKMQELGGVSDREMYKVFNMGIGMLVIVKPELQDTVVDRLSASDKFTTQVVGKIQAGDQKVIIN